MTEEELDMASVRCLRFFNVLLMIVGGAMTGLALWAGRSAIAGLGTSVAYAVAAVGASICLMTLVGLAGALTRNPAILVVFYAWLIVLAFAMLLLGGFAIAFADGVQNYVTANWASLATVLPPSQRGPETLAALLRNLRVAQLGTGGIALLLLAMVLAAMSHVTRLITAVRAYTLLLQANNVTLLPVGVALIGVGVYVADTALGVEGPALAFGVFILGVCVVSLVRLGCTGVSLRSRGLLRAFQAVTALLALAFLGFGAAAFVVAPAVISYIVGSWAVVRRFLPAGFSGKYDVAQFAAFVNANLAALGFFALCTGVLVAIQAYAAGALRAELRAEAEVEAEAAEAAAQGIISEEDVASMAELHNETSPLETAWKAWWTKGTARSRCCVRLVFTGACGVLAVVVGVATAALYYSTSCDRLDAWAASSAYPAGAAGAYVYVVNNVTFGDVVVAVNASAGGGYGGGVGVAMRKAAFRAEFAAPGFPKLAPLTRVRAVNALGGALGAPAGAAAAAAAGVPAGAPAWALNATGLTVLPGPPRFVVGVDTSCQVADVTLTLPRAGGVGGASRAAADAAPYALELVAGGGPGSGVRADWSGVAPPDRPRVRRLDAYAANGDVTLTDVLVGSAGASLAAVQGQVTLTRAGFACDPDSAGAAPGAGGVDVSSSFGGITLDGVSLADCDCTLAGSAAATVVRGTRAASAAGGARFTVTSSLGTVDVSGSAFEVLEVRGDGGAVSVANVTAAAALRASTSTGAISVTRAIFGARAAVQLESDAGAITLDATAFRGIVSVVTGGPVSCSGAGFARQPLPGSPTGDLGPPCVFSTEVATDGTTLTVVEAAYVNCDAATTCPYLGGVSVVSARGSVTLSFGAA